MVAKAMLSWFDVESVPENYVFPPERRPGEIDSPLCESIPVIDLQGQERVQIIRQIMEASENFGIFQLTTYLYCLTINEARNSTKPETVINHGLSKQVLGDAMRILQEFFSMSTEEKAKVNERGLVYTSSTDYAKDGVNLWRENLKHVCHPLEERMKLCPEKPTGFREIVGTYLIEVRKLSTTILDLISEGLGIEEGFFRGMNELQLLASNHYPPCPDPSLTLGILSHCDPSIISLLLQDVAGLQFLRNGKWIGVEAIPNSFVVIIGNQLEIISNHKLRSAEHRAVTNSSVARTSITSFINPSLGSIIEPSKVLIDASNHPPENAYRYKDFVNLRKAFGPHTDQILKLI